VNVESTKPVILVLVSHYLPGYKAGGPIRSISNIVEALGDEFDFRILTSDRDIGEKHPFPEIETGHWQPIGNARVLYISTSWRGIWPLIKAIMDTPSDLLYLNSFFGRRFSILPMFLRWLRIFRPKSVLLAPRGEFSTGALKIKNGRKTAYIKLARTLGFYSNVLWHASSQFEEQDIHNAFCPGESIAIALPIATQSGAVARKLRIMTALDMPAAGTRQSLQKLAKQAGSIRLLFLSRISRKKNLDGAVCMLAGLIGRVQLDIYGPIQDQAYWKACLQLIERLPNNVIVNYRGEAKHDAVDQLLSEHDALLFPTHGENYGHVIREAFSAGCPVVVSDQTPWRDLQRIGVGWDIPLAEFGRFQTVIQECIDMSPEDFGAFSRRACDYALALSKDPEIINQNRKLFARALIGDVLFEPAVAEVCL
jgi:glycosyltransferase involved in cell wall biosynthesis